MSQRVFSEGGNQTHLLHSSPLSLPFPLGPTLLFSTISDALFRFLLTFLSLSLPFPRVPLKESDPTLSILRLCTYHYPSSLSFHLYARSFISPSTPIIIIITIIFFSFLRLMSTVSEI